MRTQTGRYLKLLFILLASSLLSPLAFAQGVLNGKLIDAKTKEPVGFVNLGIVGTLSGTASNFDGEFHLKVSEEHLNKSLQISAVGFKTENFTLTPEFISSQRVIELTPVSYDIDEVEFTGQSLVPYGRLKDAVERIDQNYHQGGFTYSSSLKTSKTVGNQSIDKSMSVTISDTGGFKEQDFQSSFNAISYAVSNYESSIKTPPVVEGLLNIDFLLSMDLVRLRSLFMNKRGVYLYDLSTGKDTVIMGIKMWEIDFNSLNPNVTTSGDTQAKKFSGSIYINPETHAIHRIVCNGESGAWSNNGRSVYPSASGTDLKGTNVKYTYIIDYAYFGDKMALRKISLSSTYDHKGKPAKESSTLVVNELVPQSSEGIQGRIYWME